MCWLAKRALSMSMSRASPQWPTVAIACGWTEARHQLQMGRTVERSRGRLQTRQSEGNAVATKSSRTERNAALVRPANPCSRRIPARPSSGVALEPCGAPGKTWSVLSFRLTLKMHLPTRRSRPLGPRRWSKYKSSRPDSPAGSLRESVPKDCVTSKVPAADTLPSKPVTLFFRGRFQPHGRIDTQQARL